LQVHLPGEHFLTFNQGEEVEKLMSAAGQASTLTAWFVLNSDSKDDSSLRYTYEEIPSYYIFESKNKAWIKRKMMVKNEKVIGRLHGATPDQKERYYLYLILLHVRGAKSWEALKTVDGKVYELFHDAALAMHLIDDDEEYIKAMESAAFVRMPSQLRILFAHLLQHCELKDPQAFWENFADPLSEDYERAFGDKGRARQKSLMEIQNILAHWGTRLDKVGIREQPEEFNEDDFKFRELRLARAYDASAEERNTEEKRGLMDSSERPDQAALYDAIKKHVDEGIPGMFFADGPGGSGKTFVEEALLSYVRSRDEVAVPCAWSGIAAILLAGGRTCHTTFGLPVPLPAYDVNCKVSAQSGKGAVLRAAKLIIWDEAPMSPKEALETAEYLLFDMFYILIFYYHCFIVILLYLGVLLYSRGIRFESQYFEEMGHANLRYWLLYF
jgi:hypothetical protein